jgi:hypothetical protein
MSQIVRVIVLPVTLILALLLISCAAGPPLPYFNKVTLTVAPAQATVAVGGTVALRGSATGFTETPIVEWWVQEARDAGGSDDCGYLQPPLMSRCEFGFVIFGSVTQVPSSATYYAPLTPGTYHVTLETTQFATVDHVSKTATTTITVTP